MLMKSRDSNSARSPATKLLAGLGRPLLFRELAFCIFVLLECGVAAAQDVEVWEFSPYKVTIWYSIDSGTDISGLGQREFLKELDAALERTFRAAWKTRLAELPPQLEAIVRSRLDSVSMQDLIANELVLAVSLRNEQSQTIRTLDAAIDNLQQIHTTADALEQMREGVNRLRLDADSMSSRLLERLVVDDAGLESINEQLQTGGISAALVPRFHLPSVADATRSVLTPLPWQSAAFIRDIDKLFFLDITAEDDTLLFKARELDCEMQFLGPTFEARTQFRQLASRMACTVLAKAFAPVARVEEAESRSAELRLRAGGLILDPRNPASVAVGDVMQPIVRRDDRNGNPTLLEPLAWTFAAITETDGVKLMANVYTYSGGPGLQGRKNRRTRRVVLRVRPRFASTDIKISVRGTEGKVQSGCSIYQRDLLTDEFTYLDRTDWRGQLNIPVPGEFGRFLPDAVRRERFEAARLAAEQANLTAASKTADSGKSGLDSENLAASQAAPPTSDANRSEDLYGTGQDPDALLLNHPLLLIYVKNGDTVLGKLPMVPGLKPVEEAFLLDDSQRLRAEALVKGFQGEILDLIGMRNLLAARVQLYVKEAKTDPEKRSAKLEQAEKAVSELGRLRTYNEMALRLEQIQRDVLDGSSSDMSARTRNQIDRMFQTSRNLLQSYLQDDLVGNTTSLVKSMQGTSP